MPAGEGLVPSAIRGRWVDSTSDVDRVLALLNEAGYKAVSDAATVLRLRDKPSALASVADDLRKAGVNIQSLHILRRSGGYATVALTTDDRERAEEAIRGGTFL